MSDFNRITTWYRVVTQEVQTSQSSYANDPTSIEKLHNLRKSIQRAQEDTR